MKKRVLFFGLFLLAAALFVFFLVRNQKSGEFNGIRVSGTIELTEVDCAFRISGMIEELRFVEGDAVKAGDLLARLDGRELQNRREKAEASLGMTQSRVAQLLVAIEHQRMNSEGVIAQAQAKLAAAEARLRELLVGSRPQEIEQARAAVDKAQSQLRKARLEWERAQQLFATKTISKQQWDGAKAAFETATAEYERARETYGLVREGPRKETIDAARSQVAEARATLKVAEATRLGVEELERELDTAQAQVRVARADLNLAETLFRETMLYAPISGIVLSKNMEQGEMALPGSSIVTLGDLSKVWLRAYINETDLGRVRIGQPIEVRTDTYPNKVYPGRLSFISSESEFTPKQVQTQEERVKLVYRIKIDINNPLMELKSGMPADARIPREDGLEAQASGKH